MNETHVENAHVQRVESDGGRSLKFTVPSDRGWPDRLDLRPIPPQHRELVARYVRFTELKAPKKTPFTLQQIKHRELRELGFVVDVRDKK